jgi:hypothetical protein
MEIAIGNSTFYLDRILFAVCMQICWTLTLSIGGIMTNRKKDILIMSAISLMPLPILLALSGDFVGALIFVCSGAVGCGIALKNRQSVGATFAVTTMGSIGVFLAGMAIFFAKTGQLGSCMALLLTCALVPALSARSEFRQRINGELPRRAIRHSDEYDDGSCRFGDSGSGFGRSGSGF